MNVIILRRNNFKNVAELIWKRTYCFVHALITGICQNTADSLFSPRLSKRTTLTLNLYNSLSLNLFH